jgi:hypothetical protein
VGENQEMTWSNFKKYGPIVLSVAASAFTILGLVVRDKWDADVERSIDELGLLVFQAFPILYYYDINGSKGKLAVFGGIVFHLAFGTSLFFLSLDWNAIPVTLLFAQ